MQVREYAEYDGLGLAELVRKGEVRPKELADAAMAAIASVNPAINAVIETYDDRTGDLDEATLGDGPFRGVPFLIKDIGGHEAGRKIEFGSKLCEGMVSETDTYFAELLRASGVNIIGRSNTPEYSIAGTAENNLYGNTSTPWREGFSAGGSSGGAAAAVSAGIVPLAHGSDIGGSIRIPASLCGGVGLKPSRGRISAGPLLDEAGFGLAMSFVQSMSVRDTAAMLDCLSVPQVGDPFLIPRPEQSWLSLLGKPAGKLKIGYSAAPLMNAPVDPEIALAVKETAKVLEGMGHDLEEASPDFDGEAACNILLDAWFFGFDKRLDGYGRITGRSVGPDTVMPVTLKLYEYAKSIDNQKFLDCFAFMNATRRKLCGYFTKYDVWLSPSTAQVSEANGLYSQNLTDIAVEDYLGFIDRPIQFSFPYNLMGAPAISLPLAMHSGGLPIGVQLGTGPAGEHHLIQLASALEEAMPWRDRVAPIHASRS